MNYGRSSTLWARDPLRVAARLLESDGIKLAPVFNEEYFSFLIGYSNSESVKAFAVELKDHYVQVHGWGGGTPLYFIIKDTHVPPNEVHETYELQADMDLDNRPADTPLVGRRVFSFKELGIARDGDELA